jgi:hypothetical protein
MYYFRYILLFYLIISAPRYVLYFNWNVFLPEKIILEFIILFYVFLVSRVKVQIKPSHVSILKYLALFSFYILALSLGIDTLKRISIVLFIYVYMKTRSVTPVALLLLLTIASSIFFFKEDRGGFYGSGLFSAAVVEFGQNLTVWGLFLMVTIFRKIKNPYLWVFFFLEILILFYFRMELPEFHVYYINEISSSGFGFGFVFIPFILLLSKFIMRSDWMWGVERTGLDNDLMSNIIFTDFNFSATVLRFFSPLKFPFEYYLDWKLWESWEIGRTLSESIRGFGSYNIDASSWLFFSIANSLEGVIFLITFISIIMFSIVILIKSRIFCNSRGDLTNILKLLLVLFSISIAYVDRDLKIIFLVSLLVIVRYFLLMTVQNKINSNHYTRLNNN